MSNLMLTFRLLELQPETQEGEPVAPILIGQKPSIIFNAKKISSPGIRAQATSELNDFLNSQSSMTLLLDKEDATAAPLQAEELKHLAKLVSEGKRVVDSTIFHHPDHQTIVIKLEHPKT